MASGTELIEKSLSGKRDVRDTEDFDMLAFLGDLSFWKLRCGAKSAFLSM